MGKIKPSNIPNRLRNISAEHPYVAGAVDIYDDAKGENQQSINADTYRKNEVYNTDEIANILSRTPETDVVVLDVPEGSTAADVLDEVPVENRPNKLFRLRNDANTHYDEYGWTGEAWALLASKDYGIDDEPDPESDNLFSSKGAAKINQWVENTEFKKVEVDGEGKIVSSIDSKDVKHSQLRQVFHKNVTFEGDVNFNNTRAAESFDNYRYPVDSNEYLQTNIDSEGHIIEGITTDGVKHVKIPVVFEKKITVNDNTNQTVYPIILNKGVLKTFIGSTHQNNRAFTIPNNEVVYEEYKKFGLHFTRDFTRPYLMYAQHNNIHAVAIGAGYNLAFPDEQIVMELTNQVNLFDGNEHSIEFPPESGTIWTVKMKVNYWSPFNEPNFYADIPAQEFFNKLKLAYNVIKGINPAAKVLFGALSTLNTPYFYELLSIEDEEGKHLWDYIDVFDMHIYANSANYIDAISSQFNIYKKACSDFYNNDNNTNLKDKPVWVTEFGTFPFTPSNVDSVRSKILPKMLLTILAYGAEKAIFYKLVSYNTFYNEAINDSDNYYGLLSPEYNAAYAGFFYGDDSSLTADGLYDKTYILNDYNAVCYPCLQLKNVNIENIKNRGLKITGSGFTLKKVAVRDSKTSHDDIKVLWEGSTSMEEGQSIDITNVTFLDDTDAEHYIVCDIEDVQDTDVVITGFIKTNTYKTMRFLISLLPDEIETPIISGDTRHTVVSWKKPNGAYNYAVWSDYNINVGFENTEGATFYDIYGNVIDIPTSIDNTIIFIENALNLNINF